MIYIVVAIISSCIAQILLKMGSVQIGTEVHGVALLAAMAKTPLIYLAVACHGLSLVLWTRIMALFDLSFVYPIFSLNYVIIVLYAGFFMGEGFHWNRLVGSLLVVGGVALVAQR